MARDKAVKNSIRLNVSDIIVMFGVTYMTVYNWRKGIRTNKTKLPYHTDSRGEKRHSVYFIKSEVKKWAIENRIA